MKEINIQEVLHMNYRALTLLGIATSMLSDYRGELPSRCNFDWFMNAINEVVYKNNPLPPFPEADKPTIPDCPANQCNDSGIKWKTCSETGEQIVGPA